MKRRSRFGAWLSQLAGWQLIVGFLATAMAAGSATVASVGSLERRYGVLAEQMGWARTVEVTGAFEDLKQWQLYSDIRRLKRQIYDAGTPRTDRDRERFEDLQAQLTTIQAEYERIRSRKVHR